MAQRRNASSSSTSCLQSLTATWTVALLLTAFSWGSAEAWISPSPIIVLTNTQSSPALVGLPTSLATPTSSTRLYADASVSVTSSETSSPDDNDDDEEEEYEYVEYDALTEAEFVGSEWLVGTCWDDRTDKIDETWVRLVVSEDGKNMCYWGDKAEGKWSLDVASQFLSISKESLFGKQIWAGIVEDYYFLQGTVRGWTYLQPASVLAQWQAKRLGVDKDEAGIAPWFQEETEEEEGTQEKSS